ncbi:squamosa promoter-binding-like protein 7 isoform X2 [Diospyros lotus]|uniref:squamosa promoter-binding-like protein 7 isoform X2 n=1 Tax=Diospyros lotus TaxID=55363 RepID=UPI002253341B|nr:squamosa promoter-binding-like protein 7 isoform X2 [Diospyros lotus]
MDPPPPVSDAPAFHQIDNSLEPSLLHWDWSDFLDFNLDDHVNISIDSEPPPLPPQEPELPPNPATSGRVRKRDPRMVCSNFLAGRIPCACPEMDAMLEEEDRLSPEKKKSRATRAAPARCQVPGCKADISELKGYHRRHRVCLRCANASSVALDGKRKRYCQQCGKFHILSDFDEGKRSCRRKLERHNNRRRRKPCESIDAADRDPQAHALADYVPCDDANEKDSICVRSQMVEMESLLGSEEGQISTLYSNLVSQNIQNDSDVSFVASGEAQIDGEKDECKHACPSACCENKSAYSSTCPTGRISFKLYDWNPAEFPRRLRHQIFEWLANMPVELEGYIRPGCTILTVFTAMPNFIWLKLLQDPVVYIHDIVAAPGKMLSGRGTLLVYLDNVIFQVLRDGTSIMQVKPKEQAPKLHYVHPTCFEAGKPMEFMACGSNLLQPKFRFLVSFAGKYMAYDYCVPTLSGDTERVTANFNHQLLKIHIPHTEPDLFGPAFIEVENESGLSNFIPILIGDKDICSEMKIMEHRFEASLCLKGSMSGSSSVSDSCAASVLRQTAFSQFILDTAWLLKKPPLEDLGQCLSLSQIARFNRLLTFLIHKKSTSILETVLHYMESVMDRMKLENLNGTADEDMKCLLSNIDRAREILCQRLQGKADLALNSGNLVCVGDWLCPRSQSDMLPISCFNQDMENIERGHLDAVAGPSCQNQSDNTPLLNRQAIIRINPTKRRPRKASSCAVSSRYSAPRPLIFILAAAAVCFVVCAATLHPEKVGKIATTIRRCLFDNR